MVCVTGWKELKAAAGWWVLGVVIGGLSGNAAGALAGLWPVLLAASLGGALAALGAAAVMGRGQPGVDARAFLAQEELVGDLADQLTLLEADVQSLQLQEKAARAVQVPGLERVQ